MEENSFSKKIIEENIKKKILIYFTFELIKNSKSKEIAGLKRVIQKKEETEESEKNFESIFGDMITKIELIKKTQQKNNFLKRYHPYINPTSINQNESMINNMSINNLNISKEENRMEFNPNKNRYNIKKRVFDVPDIPTPPHLNYLKPIKEKTDVSFLKINPLIKDPRVREMIANPDDNVIVKGTMGVMPSIIYLTKEDIIEIIKTFSKYSKIPLNEGVYKVVLGDLIMSAYINKKNQDFKFKIKKM